MTFGTFYKWFCSRKMPNSRDYASNCPFPLANFSRQSNSLVYWKKLLPENYWAVFYDIWTIAIYQCLKVFQLTFVEFWHVCALGALFITRDSEVIMFSSCVFVCLCVCGCLCLSRCLSRRFNYEGLVPHKQYFAGTLLGMSSCASYVSRTHHVIDDVTRSQSRSNF